MLTAGRRLLQSGQALDMVFVSVANDEMYLMLSDENVQKYKIHAITLRQSANGGSDMVLCADTACRNSILQIADLKSSDANVMNNVQATAGSSIPLFTAPVSAGAAKVTPDDNDDGQALLIVGITLGALILLSVVGIVIWSYTRSNVACDSVGAAVQYISVPDQRFGPPPPPPPMQYAPQYPCPPPPMQYPQHY